MIGTRPSLTGAAVARKLYNFTAALDTDFTAKPQSAPHLEQNLDVNPENETLYSGAVQQTPNLSYPRPSAANCSSQQIHT